MVLPISMNPHDYGKVILSNIIHEGITFERFIVVNANKTYQIDVIEGGLINRVTILGNIELTWTDTKISGTDIFKREIKKSTIYFMDGEIVLRKQMLPAKPFRRLQPDKSVITNFYTMDIETINKDSKKVPYLITSYNGSDYITSYSNESLDQKSLFTNFFNQLLESLPVGKTLIYAHNLSGFDGIFILRYLLDYGQVQPLLFNNKLMSIKLTIGSKDNKKVIVFKDSYLLLPLSLRKLCAAFNVSIPKGYFPFLLNDILYKGILPKLEYWTNITIKDYELIIKEWGGVAGKVWSFRDEAIKYCKLDCKTLHEIITCFNKLIFDHFNVDSHQALTLPALSLRIYKTHFMPKNTIYQLLNKAEINIRDSYTGGAVDVYIPHNGIYTFFNLVKGLFKTLYYYDVNGLYPYVMLEFDMPVGKPVAFLLKLGNIRAIDPKAYGFFYCKITSPDYLEYPILQRRIKTSSGTRTIAGLGTWTGWIFSTEMDRLRHAMKFGYNFEIIKGYEFEKGNIFKDYVNKMYDLRLQYDKGTAMNLIAKLLMNSLYGKFGMRLESTIVEMFDTSNALENELLNEMLDTYGMSVQDFIKIDNKLLTVRNTVVNSVYYNDDDGDTYHGSDVNIAIASAVTAGGRMWMSLLKNNPNVNLYYSDTDSGVVDQPLDEALVGPLLGQFKLEHILSRAVFLAPKVYGFITTAVTPGNEIIKIKGVKNELLKDIHIQDLENLLFLDSSRVLSQEKWIKNYQNGNITFKDVAYTLKITSNKRTPIYNNNVFSNTEPLNYDQES